MTQTNNQYASNITDAGLKNYAAELNKGQNLWGLALSGILAGIGAYKQYDLYEKQGDLAEAQAEAVKSNIKIVEDVHNSIVKPQHERAKDFFWNFIRTSVKKVEQLVIDCGLKYCEYEGDPDEDVVSGLADAAGFIKAAELALARSTAPFAIGECCDNKFRMAALRVTTFANTKNNGRKYYRELKLRYESLYWQKQLGAAQIAQNTQQIGANLLVNAGSQVLGSLDGMARAVALADNAVQSQFTALNAQAGAIGAATNSFNGLIGNYFGGQDANNRTGAMLNLLGSLRVNPVATGLASSGYPLTSGAAGTITDFPINGFD